MMSSFGRMSFYKKSLKVLLAGFLFVLFGAICLLGNAFFIPCILLNLHKFLFFQYLSRDIVRYSWRFFILCAQALGYISLDYKHFDKPLQKGELIIANHPSLLDVVLILSRIKRLNCVVKAALRKNIFLFAAIKASGYILNDDEERLLRACEKALLKGEALLVFPEGTRTQDKISFHKAPFYIAIKAARTLTPIFINMQPKSLQKGSKWYNVPDEKITYVLSAQKSLNLASFEPTKPDPLRVRALHKDLSMLYLKENL